MASLLQRRRSTEVHQTLHDVWPSAGLVYNIYVFGTVALPPNGILPGAKFTLRLSLAFSCFDSVTARHWSSGRQPNFAAWYKERNFRSTEAATYIPRAAVTLGIGSHSSYGRPA